MPDIKELFKKFVFAYIAAGHTQTDESEAELKQLIDGFVDTIHDDEDCFNSITLTDIIYYVEDHITDENKGFYRFYLNNNRYMDTLEKFIKHIIKLFNKNLPPKSPSN